MNPLGLTLKSLRHRKFTVGLTVVSLALGVALLLGVERMRHERFGALWPRYHELLWAMGELRARAAGVDLHARYLPACVASEVGDHHLAASGPGASAVAPSREALACTTCDVECPGLDRPYQRLYDAPGPGLPLEAAPPPEVAVDDLEELLEPLPSPAHDEDMARAAALLEKLVSGRRPLTGYTLARVGSTYRSSWMRW